jgi:pimeloyl-ACP methyl ester carboxylesterase
MNDSIGPPPAFHMLLEGRLAAEASRVMLQLPLLRMQLPHGEGDVLVLPGFMADDTMTWLLRQFLGGLGYRAHGWGLGVNRGPLLPYIDRIVPRLINLIEKSGSTPSLVGWSRGGVLAREVARDRPDLVRSIVTLGSPVRGGVHGTRIGAWVSRTTGITPEQISRTLAERQRRPIEVPITAIYSRTDGVVSWQACRDELTEGLVHEEVDSSHMGLVANVEVFRRIARALARFHG